MFINTEAATCQASASQCDAVSLIAAATGASASAGQLNDREDAQAGYFITQAVLLTLYVAAIWWAVQYVLVEARAAQRLLERGSQRITQLYASKRVLLRNVGFLRVTQLIASITYMSCLTYMHLVNDPIGLKPLQTLGILVIFVLVTALCSGWLVSQVPSFQNLLVDYHALVSLFLVSVAQLFCNYGGVFELAPMLSFYDKVLYFNLLWVLEDCPLSAYLPLHVVSLGMYITTQMSQQPLLWTQPLQLAAMLLLYTILGVLLPMVLSLVIWPPGHSMGAQSALHGAVAIASTGFMFVDLVLRIKYIAEPLQDMAASSVVCRLLVANLMGSVPAGAKYSFGLHPSLAVGFLGILLAMAILCSLIMSLAEDGTVPGSHMPSHLMFIYKSSVLSALLGLLRSLPTGKKYVVCLVASVACMQLGGIVTILVQLLLFGADGFHTNAPLVLLLIMLGMVVEVFGVLSIIMPGGSTCDDNISSSVSLSHWDAAMVFCASGLLLGVCAMDFPNPARLTIGTSPSHLTRRSSRYADASEGITLNSGRSSSLQIGVGRGLGMPPAEAAEGTDFSSRMESLANFKTFMQGLDQQPDIYLLEEFIKGAGNAIKGVFPAVNHASLCLLNSGRSSLNMYTFLGEGSHKPPRINVAVARGTLIYYVLHNCQPVFITNISTFPGPYSDIQFMRFVLGLKSVTCLPLVVAGSRILGVLRLGFEEPWNWTEQEKALAKQLALVLSSSQQGLGGGGGGGGSAASMQSASSQPSQSSSSYGPRSGHQGSGAPPTVSRRASGASGPQGSAQHLRSSVSGPNGLGYSGAADSGYSGASGPTNGSGSQAPATPGYGGMYVLGGGSLGLAGSQSLGLSGGHGPGGYSGASGGSLGGPSLAYTGSVGGPRRNFSGSQGHGPGGSQGHGPSSSSGFGGASSCGQRVASADNGPLGGCNAAQGPSGPAYVSLRGGAAAAGAAASVPSSSGAQLGASLGEASTSSMGNGPHMRSPRVAGTSYSSGMLPRTTSTSSIHERLEILRQSSRMDSTGLLSGAQGLAEAPARSADGTCAGGSAHSEVSGPTTQGAGDGSSTQQWQQQYGAASVDQGSVYNLRRPPHAQSSIANIQQQMQQHQERIDLGNNSNSLQQQPYVNGAASTELRSSRRSVPNFDDIMLDEWARNGFPASTAEHGSAHDGLSDQQYSQASHVSQSSHQQLQRQTSQLGSQQHYSQHQQHGSLQRTTSGVSGARERNQASDIEMFEVVGRGGFGSVHKALWRKQIVAVKVLEHGDDFMGCSDAATAESSVDAASHRAAQLEGAMTSLINHPNIVQTFDYRIVHLDPQLNAEGRMPHNRVAQETHIIMEFCDKGSLQDVIEQGMFLEPAARSRRASLTRTAEGGEAGDPEPVMDLLIMTLMEVAAAMEYLHSNRFTHRDLKPKNILLKSKPSDPRGFTAKVSDFGLSQVLPDTNKTQVSTRYSGTVTHMPPELIEDGKIYQQGDVYAFGIIMWEVYTGQAPYPKMAHPQIMVGVVTHNLRPKFPENTPEWYKTLAFKCWRKDPKARPSFAEVSVILAQHLSDPTWVPAGATQRTD